MTRAHASAFALGLVTAAFAASVHAAAPAQPPPVEADTGNVHEGQALFNAEAPEAFAQRISWWAGARFGMFVHWGLYAQDGCHWNGQDGKTEHMMRHLRIPLAEYAKIATVFNPVKFDADAWVKAAKAAGMKYLVFTAKHHDGFAMFASKASGYNIVARTPFARDPVKELALACRRRGVKLGIYYSLGRDWEDPDVPTKNGYRSNTWDYPDEAAKDFSKYFERKVRPQIRELLTQYGPIAVMWFDTPEQISKEQSEEMVRTVRGLQPGIVINARVGNRLGDYAVEEQKVPEGSVGPVQPWETCMTLNKHWGYHKLDDEWKSTETVLRTLIDVASKGGNFLLNVGPTGEGVIPAPSLQRLADVGRWMKVNGDSIYGTSACTLPKQAWGRCTTRETSAGPRHYLHVFDWPTEGKLLVSGVDPVGAKATLLATGKRLPTVKKGDGVAITVPTEAPDKLSSTVVLQLRKPRKPPTRTSSR